MVKIGIAYQWVPTNKPYSGSMLDDIGEAVDRYLSTDPRVRKLVDRWKQFTASYDGITPVVVDATSEPVKANLSWEGQDLELERRVVTEGVDFWRAFYGVLKKATEYFSSLNQ